MGSRNVESGAERAAAFGLRKEERTASAIANIVAMSRDTQDDDGGSQAAGGARDKNAARRG